MLSLTWLLAGFSAVCLLLALLWGWQRRCRRLLRQGGSLGQAAWLAWEAPFASAWVALGSMPLLNEWRQRYLEGGADDASLSIVRTMALTGLAAMLMVGVLFAYGFPLGQTLLLCMAAVPAAVLHRVQQVRRLWSRRSRASRRELPFFLDLLVLALESGLGLQQAWVQALNSVPAGALQQSLNQVLADVRAGHRLSAAMRNAAGRVRQADLDELALALELAQETGLSLASLLRAQAEQLRQRVQLEAEQRALKLPVYLLMPLVLCVFPCTFLVLGMTLAGPWLVGQG
ncbi:MAG TPA: type II secretion system F family protein [Alcaligenes sp.]|nr:type II secretion system F family protein [Alcaligenes sp.]HRL26019.1 type II secretion system F family protein [Alcaligenes sp.]